MSSTLLPTADAITPKRRIWPPDWLYERTFARLNAVREQARILTIDESSRFVFFADLHRGDCSLADRFRDNSDLFSLAMEHYYARGFAYCEVGDGDELWKHHSLDVVEQSHPRAFGLLRRFDREGRLFMVLGNHDIAASRREAVRKGSFAMEEGLRLRHARTGREILVVHGHQADFVSDGLYPLARWAVRYIWQPLERLGLASGSDGDVDAEVWLERRNDPSALVQGAIERRLRQWVGLSGCALLCGHTHRPSFPCAGDLPYFNVGAGVEPGTLTGVEIERDHIVLIRWHSPKGGTPRRQPLSPSVPLAAIL